MMTEGAGKVNSAEKKKSYSPQRTQRKHRGRRANHRGTETQRKAQRRTKRGKKKSKRKKKREEIPVFALPSVLLCVSLCLCASVVSCLPLVPSVVRPWRLVQKSPAGSPPARVPRARQTARSMVEGTDRTEPSMSRTLTMPVW